MQRTIDDYDAMIKREIIKAKQEKGQMYVLRLAPPLSSPPSRRVQKFRADYADLKSQFEHTKNEVRFSVHCSLARHTTSHREPPPSATNSSALHRASSHRPRQTHADASPHPRPYSTPSLLSEHQHRCQTLPYASTTHSMNTPSSKPQRPGSTNSLPRVAKSWTTSLTSATC